jgi:hypothetical protein
LPWPKLKVFIQKAPAKAKTAASQSSHLNPHFSKSYYCGDVSEHVCFVYPIYAKHKWGAPIGLLDVLKALKRSFRPPHGALGR